MKLNLKGVAQKISQNSATSPAKVPDARILLVDDEEPNLLMLAKNLAGIYDVTTKTSAVDALALIDSGKPEGVFSVIISDQMMPGMSGVEFLKELKSREVPALRILLTGFSALDTVISAVNDAGIFRYLTKPVNMDHLITVVREAQDQYATKKENSKLIGLVKTLIEKNSNYEKQMPQLVQEQIKMPEWSPRHRDLVVLFADIRGFTTAARQANPADTFSILEQIFNPLHELVYEVGGFVDKLLGDGFMAIFGLTGTFNIHNVVNVTKQMAHKSQTILENLPPPFDQLKISFGLAKGTVMVGMMGTIHHSEYVVIGDTANLAARLQETTKLALTHEAGKKAFGDFKRAMVLCTENLLTHAIGFRPVDIEDKIYVRDFSDIKRIGVFTPE
jgi:class 3 adenylate cyclase/CheY-like chemotaxis protein